MSPRVSVVVPAYNNDQYIRETLESILAQSFSDFELLVADHSSQDRTWEILQDFRDDPRVRLFTTPAGGSAQRNWNRVTEQATGELLKLVCGDDLLDKEALKTQVAAFDAHDDKVVMVASRRDIVDASGRHVMRNIGLGGLRGRVPGPEAVRRSVLRGANIFGEPACVMVRRTALERVGLWHGNPGYIIDQATYSRVLLEGDFVATPESLAAFRISATQWSVQLVREQARSAAEMHRQLAELSPGLLSRRDLVIGDSMAALRAAQRRLVYLYLRGRMSPDTPDSSERLHGSS